MHSFVKTHTLLVINVEGVGTYISAEFVAFSFDCQTHLHLGAILVLSIGIVSRSCVLMISLLPFEHSE